MAIDPIGSAHRTSLSSRLSFPAGLAIIGVIAVIIGGILLGVVPTSSAGGIMLGIGITFTVLGFLNAGWRIIME